MDKGTELGLVMLFVGMGLVAAMFAAGKVTQQSGATVCEQQTQQQVRHNTCVILEDL